MINKANDQLTCENCGACCQELESPPFMPEYLGGEELPALPIDVRADYERGMRFRDALGWPERVPCFWLTEERECKHYEHRPESCRVGLACGDAACRRWREGLIDEAEEFLAALLHIT